MGARGRDLKRTLEIDQAQIKKMQVQTRYYPSKGQKINNQSIWADNQRYLHRRIVELRVAKTPQEEPSNNSPQIRHLPLLDITQE